MAHRPHIIGLLASVILAIATPCGAATGLTEVSTTATPPTVADGCFSDWSAAVPVVQREALAAVRDVHAQARIHKVGDVVRVTLCTEQGRFVYRLVVREPQGRVIPMTVDARRPFGQ